MKIILLTFDVEEFDLLEEFDCLSLKEKEFEIPKEGLLSIINLLDKHDIKATFFTTTIFAKKHSKIIKNIVKKGHEIASHGYAHSDDYSKDISRAGGSKKEIEKIIKSKIKGFRAPRFGIKNISQLSDFGFVYDSSIHPTLLPGRYNNLFKPRKIHKIGNIVEIPPSTSPLIRLPLFWLAFKNFPEFYPNLFTRTNFLFSDYTMLVQHPWEFADLSKFKIPNYIKKNPFKRLEKYILFCKKNNYLFDTISGYFEKHGSI